MVGSNTETGISVTYDDSDNTLDFVIGTLNQDTTGTADNITVSANNSTDETVYPIFVDGATGSQGAESDTGLTYNPSSGLLTTTLLAGTLNTAAQTNITSLGTLTALTVDNVVIDGAVIGHTSDTDLITLSSGVVTVAGELDATSLDISGDADIDGTLEADAITIGGVTLAETISDTVGAMVTSNTETGITVAYQDADNTLDFTIGTLNQDTTGTADNITVSANNSTDETVYPIFVDGATGSQGAESDTGLTYNPSSGVLTATQFTGNLTGNVTGNTSGTAATY
jgi:cytoskeletal protein CcmA (bactofilin family)